MYLLMISIVISCSLQKDMLYQGKLYITQNRLCFYSSIIGFVKMVRF